jgi:CheY-like chemotaxis protein
VNSQKRILIIEDNPNVVEAHMFYLSQLKPPALIDSVDSKFEAIERIRRKLYHVAVVDLQLKEDVTSKGGLDVVEYISELGEGTRAIIVTQDDTAKSARFGYRHGVVDYLFKGEDTGYDLLEKVRAMLKDSDDMQKLKYGSFGSLHGYLAAPENVPWWEDQMHRALGVSFGSFQEATSATLAQYAPILRPWNSQGGAFTIDSDAPRIHGTFWSKMLGQPIWVSLSGPGGDPKPPVDESGGKEIWKSQGGDVKAVVWQLVDASRDDFVDNVLDVRAG